jgi:hypothetical protein
VSKADEPLPLTSNERVKMYSFVYMEEKEKDSTGVEVQNRTGSWVKGQSDVSRVSGGDSESRSSVPPLSLSLRPHTPADELDDEENSEIAEAMMNGCGDGGSEGGGGVSRSSSLLLRERPGTPSRIPRPNFSAPRPANETPTPTPQGPRTTNNSNSQQRQVLPRPSTPNRAVSVESESSLSEKPPVTPRRISSSSLVPRCATPSACTTSRSYAEMYQVRRSQTPGPGSSSSSSVSASSSGVRASTPGPTSGSGSTNGGAQQSRRDSLTNR